jgi:hypothetical protein
MHAETTQRPSRRTLAVDPQGFAAAERTAAYEIAQTLLTTCLRLQNGFGLRPEEFQVLLVIILATVQRYVRDPDADPAYLTRAPLHPDLAGTTSRRRIADVTGIPLETVRRHVTRLMVRGFVIEQGRGRISTPGGTLARLSVQDIPMSIVGDLAALSNVLLRLGALRLADQGGATEAEPPRPRPLPPVSHGPRRRPTGDNGVDVSPASRKP